MSTAPEPINRSVMLHPDRYGRELEEEIEHHLDLATREQDSARARRIRKCRSTVIGESVNGNRIWVSFGPINFQPAEFSKILLAIFFASYLVEKREILAIASWPRFRPVLPDPKHLGPVLAAWALAIVVMTAMVTIML